MMQWHIVCDFDGTITRTDVIDNILQRFADPSWQAIEAQWVQGEIGSRECLSRQLSLVNASPAQLLAYFAGWFCLDHQAVNAKLGAYCKQDGLIVCS